MRSYIYWSPVQAVLRLKWAWYKSKSSLHSLATGIKQVSWWNTNENSRFSKMNQ